MGISRLEIASRHTMYLAYETIRLVLPQKSRQFENRFIGLFFQRLGHIPGEQRLGSPHQNLGLTNDEVIDPLAYDDIPPPGPLRISESLNHRLRFTLEEGAPSEKFIPLIMDSILLEFINRHRERDSKVMKEQFCERELGRIIRRYFPNIDLKQSGFQRLQKICQELNLETRAVMTSPGREGRAGQKQNGGPLLESRSPAWREMMATALPAARSKAPILLTGESGVGKEVLGRFIHINSPRGSGPFVPIHCGALPESLLESELFGYLRGAFTGADRDRPGLAAQAHGGTLFLDEIGLMPLSLQSKLLRFLQDHAFYPLGGRTPVKVDVRIVAATNVDLNEARDMGEFRDDLYYRLNVFRLELPTLRDRIQDLPAFADHFIHQYNRENRTAVTGLSPEALNFCYRYGWPGNIRELENTIQRAVILARTGHIQTGHLPPEITSCPGPSPDSGPAAPDSLAPDTLLWELKQALELPSETDGRSRRLGESIPLTHLAAFFLHLGERSFPPRRLADFICPPGRRGRRDKLTGRILKALLNSGLIEHNGRPAQASRYRLNLERLKGAGRTRG